ncbi:MAG TPA: zinc ribbon domain-containing protein [Terriglobales bacterium]|nr:zinc ribbon domain-containing protein [Terriglobales bacterium]
MGTTAAAPSGRDFNSVFEAGIASNGALRNGGVSDRLRDRLVREEQAKLHRQGWEKATVMNLQPFPLMLQLGELGTVEVPAAQGNEPARVVIDRYRLSMRDMGDGNFIPVSVLPAEIAKEVEREYGATGGVFWYWGDGEPKPAEVEAARERQFGWWRKIYQQAVDAWTRYHQHKMLTDRQRDAARALFAAGEIAELPEWMTITRAQADRRPCPMCGEDIKVAAKICHYCRTPLGAAADVAEVSPDQALPLVALNEQRRGRERGAEERAAPGTDGETAVAAGAGRRGPRDAAMAERAANLSPRSHSGEGRPGAREK